MDALTQGFLGAAVAQAALGNKIGNKAGLLGLVGGMVPDLDLVIRSSSDPLLALEYHRHFTHALAFIPVGGTLVGVLGWLLWRKSLSVGQAILAAIIGYATHGLLDVFTSYGTVFFWPFSSARIALDWVGIVDLFVTLPLILGTAIAWKRRSRRPAAVGLALALLYMGFGVLQHARASHIQAQIAQARGQSPVRGRVMPQPFNLLLYRSIYEVDDKLVSDAIRVGLFSPTVYWEGAVVDKLTPDDLVATTGTDSILARDVRRFAWFTDGYLFLHPQSLSVIGDFRYSLSPNGVLPAWGIRLDAQRPDRHVTRTSYRNGFDTTRYWDMLKGSAPGAIALNDLPTRPRTAQLLPTASSLDLVCEMPSE